MAGCIGRACGLTCSPDAVVGRMARGFQTALADLRAATVSRMMPTMSTQLRSLRPTAMLGLTNRPDIVRA